MTAPEDEDSEQVSLSQSDQVVNSTGGDKKKEKRSKTFYSKIVIRRLPATMKEEEFVECVDPLPEHDYFRFVKADFSLEKDACTRAYINFINQDDVFAFQQKFDGYVFVDNKGNEHVAVVEFAPNQKVPHNKEGKRKDLKMNTLDQDPEFNKFLESLTGEQDSTPMPTIEQVLEEIEAKEREMKSGGKQTTPLLQYMKDKKEEKIRKREEQFEARERKDKEMRKIFEEERQRRKEKKEKEIRDREKRDKAREEKNKDKRDSEEHDRKKEKPEKKKREELTTEEREQKIREKREAEKEKRREREEREKERFRKREEERQKRRAERLERIRLENEEKEAKEVASSANAEGESKDGVQEQDSDSKRADAGAEGGKESTPEAGDQEVATTTKAKRYSDRRREERLKKEKERQEKLKKKAEVKVQEEEEVVVEDRVKEVVGKEEKMEVVVEPDSKPDKTGEAKDGVEVVDLEKDHRDEDEELERWKQERKAAKEKREKAREKEREERIQRRKELDRKKNKERPDMQIYRPGMGKFSSRTIKKESTASPKTSPEESRETSPSRKSANEPKDPRKDRRDRKGRDDVAGSKAAKETDRGGSGRARDDAGKSRESGKRSYNTRNNVSKSFKEKKKGDADKTADADSKADGAEYKAADADKHNPAGGGSGEDKSSDNSQCDRSDAESSRVSADSAEAPGTGADPSTSKSAEAGPAGREAERIVAGDENVGQPEIEISGKDSGDRGKEGGSDKLESAMADLDIKD